MSKLATVAMLKHVPEKWEADRNWDVFEEQFALHAADADVFVTPEGFLDGYATTEDDWTAERFASVSERIDQSARVERLSSLAREHETAIVFGLTQILNDRFYNTALVIDREGAVSGVYHKTHLQNRDRRFSPGKDLPVFDLHFGRIGIVICADRRWPESMRVIRLKGAKVCLMPTYGMWHDENEAWMKTRGYENQMFVCFTHPRVSLITGPTGKVEAKLQSNVPDVLVHTIDLDEARDDNHLQDRRPDLYEIISDKTHDSAQPSYNSPEVCSMEKVS